MTQSTAATRPVGLPVVIVTILFAVLAVVLEAALRVQLRLPGHRALPGALVLLVVAYSMSPARLLVVAAGLGALTAAIAGAPLLVGVWLVPAILLALGRGWPARARVASGLACGLVFGLLRCFSSPATLHHTPQLLRLGGHLAFGALGAAAALALLSTRREDRGCASR
jgi:hypothetical protein